jgi:hypothetical protein
MGTIPRGGEGVGLRTKSSGQVANPAGAIENAARLAESGDGGPVMVRSGGEQRSPKRRGPDGLSAGAAARADWRWAWIGLAVGGLVLRLALLPLSPRLTYEPDHDDFVRWGIQIVDTGLLGVYTTPPPPRDLRHWDADAKRWVIAQRPMHRICNYPPGSVYLLGISGVAHRVLAGEERLINTTLSHALLSAWAILGDVILAVGCAQIVRRYRSEAYALVVFALVLFAPPLWWDSVLWGQMDAVVLAPLVWMLACMLSRRWVMAGVLWGVALGLKPQAILLVPVWVYALATVRPLGRVVIGCVLAPATLLVLSLPFTIGGGYTWLALPALGGLRLPVPTWLHVSYLQNLFEAYHQYLSLKAFNLWYPVSLAMDSNDATHVVFGLSLHAWGRVLLVLGLVGGFVATWRCCGRRPEGLVLYSALSLLAFVMLPTSVHERYLIVALVPLGVVAALWPRFWAGLLLWVVVAMGQMTWPLWLDEPPGKWRAVEAQFVQRYVETEGPLPADGAVPEALHRQLSEARVGYLYTRARSAGIEWGLTALSLFAGLLLVWSVAALPTSTRKGPERSMVMLPDTNP